MKTFKNLLRVWVWCVMFFGTLTFAADPAQYGTPFSGVPDPRDANVYQVHIRPYSTAGNLAGVIARLDAIKALGINVIYLMPIYPHGTDSKSSASPYCIKDYNSVASEYGTLTDLRSLVDGAHSRGMAVILDIAINGTSWDHAWITAHPDWYIQSGGVIQQLGSFTDIAALNFANTSMRAALVDAFRFWIFTANVDGYRCDYANNPPLDFWTNTISNLRGITTHKLLMLAEGDRLENFQCGFDYNFGDKWYYDAISKIATGTSVAQIQTTTNTEYTYATGSQQEVRYTTNHDIQSSTTPFSVFTNHNGVVVNYLVSAYMRGVPFLASGQEVDFNQTIPWPYQTVKINWTANTGAAADFTKVLTFRNTSVAIRRGTMTNYSDANVCAFTKVNGTEKVVVMANLRNSTQNYVIPAALAGSYKDAYTSAAVTLTSGATQSLTAYQYRVLTNASVTPVAVTGVSVSPTSASVPKGLTQQLTATISPSNATNQTVSWTSNNTTIATVSANGLVTAVNTGTATITCTTQDGSKTATCAITVTAATGFTVYFYKPSSWGSTINIYYWNTVPAGVIPTVTWPGVAMTADVNGWYKYTFVNVTSTSLIFNDGTNQTADLTRSTNGWYQNNTWYNSLPGNVVVTGVSVSPTSASIVRGGTQQLTATVSPTNATNTSVTWTSSNTSIATVSSSGLVTAIAAGAATITVKTVDQGKTATCAITVTAPVTTYYAIKNRWKGTYLYDAGANVAYGTTIANNNYLWDKQTIDATYFWLKNAGTGEYMHIENQTGYVQCTAADVTWWSTQWSADYIDGTWIRIRNRWITGDIVHVESQNGYAQYAGAQDGWYSAQWQLVPTALKSADASLSDQGSTVATFMPNPVINELNIDFRGNSFKSIAVFDVSGKVFRKLEIDPGASEYQLDLSALTKGIYFICLTNEINTQVLKVVKE
jgi:uncharacterized protein YjdB